MKTISLLFSSLLMVILAFTSACPDAGTGSGQRLPRKLSVNQPNPVNRASKATPNIVGIVPNVVSPNFLADCAAGNYSSTAYFQFQGVLDIMDTDQKIATYILDLARNLNDTEAAQAKSTSININKPAGDPMSTNPLEWQAITYNLQWREATPAANFDALIVTFNFPFSPSDVSPMNFTLTFDKVKLQSNISAGKLDARIAPTTFNDGFNTFTYLETVILFEFEVNEDTGIGWSSESYKTGYDDGFNSDSYSSLIYMESDNTISGTGISLSYIDTYESGDASGDYSNTSKYKMTGYVDNSGGSIITTYKGEYIDTIGGINDTWTEKYIDEFDSGGCLTASYYEDNNGDFIDAFDFSVYGGGGTYDTYVGEDDLSDMMTDFDTLDDAYFAEIYGFGSGNPPVYLDVTVNRPDASDGILTLFLIQGTSLTAVAPSTAVNLETAQFNANVTLVDGYSFWLDSTYPTDVFSFVIESNVDTVLYAYWDTNFDIWDASGSVDPAFAENAYSTAIINTAVDQSTSIW